MVEWNPEKALRDHSLERTRLCRPRAVGFGLGVWDFRLRAQGSVNIAWIFGSFARAALNPKPTESWFSESKGLARFPADGLVVAMAAANSHHQKGLFRPKGLGFRVRSFHITTLGSM